MTTHTPLPPEPEITDTTLFKVLGKDGSAYHGGGGAWYPPNGKQPGKWMPPLKGEIQLCRNGYRYLTGTRQLLEWLGPVLWIVEVRSDIATDSEKGAARQARLLERVENWNEVTARLFAADCAHRALKREQDAGQEPASRSWQAVEAARLFATGQMPRERLDAAWDAAWDAAGNAEKDWQAQRLADYLRLGVAAYEPATSSPASTTATPEPRT